MLHSGPKIVLGHIGDLKSEENSLVVDDNDDIGNCINKGEVNLYFFYVEVHWSYLYFYVLMVASIRWLVGLKQIQLEQQKTLPFIILAKNSKPILCRVIKFT